MQVDPYTLIIGIIIFCIALFINNKHNEQK